jgi:hypothetical protein
LAGGEIVAAEFGVGDWNFADWNFADIDGIMPL